MADTTIAVLGAGLQGSLFALAAAERGARVTLIDRLPRAVAAASLTNEGKIHLGYIFANDPAGKTPRLLAGAAGCFSQIIGRYVDISALGRNLSTPFVYLVLPESIVPAAELARRYAMIDAEIARHAPDYLGQGPPCPVTPLADAGVDGGVAFRTGELAVRTDWLAREVHRSVVAHPRITPLFDTEVLGLAARDAGPPGIVTRGAGMLEGFDHVVNASWRDMLRLDATLGLVPDRPWLFRRKTAHIVRLAEPRPDIASVTMVLGPFGDVVSFDAGRQLYLSWYPTGCTERTGTADPPASWDDAPPDDAEGIFRSAIAHLGRRLPGIASLPADLCRSTVSGTIFSWGEGDVDQPDSELHRRYEVGPTSYANGYHRVDTGKYTLAPLFAERLAERILPR